MLDEASPDGLGFGQMRRFVLRGLAAGGFSSLLLVSGWARAAPSPSLWSHWTSHNPGSRREIDHSAWDSWLGRYVVVDDSGAVLIAYANIRRSDRYLLNEYIRDLESLNVTRYKRKEQLAFWINLYNALIVTIVLDNWPITSPRELPGAEHSETHGPWDEKLVTIEGHGVSPNDIENRILRPIWRDPRVLYALHRAALGSPALATKAYTAQNTDRQLDRIAKAYVNSPHGTWVAEGRLTVSALYKWYPKDFGADDQELIEHLKIYAEPELRDKLQSVESVYGHRYDWRLNDERLRAELAAEPELGMVAQDVEEIDTDRDHGR